MGLCMKSIEFDETVFGIKTKIICFEGATMLIGVWAIL